MPAIAIEEYDSKDVFSSHKFTQKLFHRNKSLIFLKNIITKILIVFKMVFILIGTKYYLDYIINK